MKPLDHILEVWVVICCMAIFGLGFRLSKSWHHLHSEEGTGERGISVFTVGVTSFELNSGKFSKVEDYVYRHCTLYAIVNSQSHVIKIWRKKMKNLCSTTLLSTFPVRCWSVHSPPQSRLEYGKHKRFVSFSLDKNKR